MQQFEYETYTINLAKAKMKDRTFNETTIKEKLNEMGAQGWELVNKVENLLDGWTMQVVLIFKRLK